MNLYFKNPLLEIHGLRLRTTIGVLPEERQAKQEIEVDLKLYLDKLAAITSDNLSDTVDYALLTEKISSLVENSSFFLIESLSRAILEEIFRWPYVRKAEVIVKKSRSFALRFAKEVSFHLTGEKVENDA